MLNLTQFKLPIKQDFCKMSVFFKRPVEEEEEGEVEVTVFNVVLIWYSLIRPGFCRTISISGMRDKNYEHDGGNFLSPLRISSFFVCCFFSITLLVESRNQYFVYTQER